MKTISLHLTDHQALVWDSLVYLNGGGRQGKRKATDELIDRALLDENVADCVHVIRRRRTGLRLVLPAAGVAVFATGSAPRQDQP